MNIKDFFAETKTGYLTLQSKNIHNGILNIEEYHIVGRDLYISGEGSGLIIIKDFQDKFYNCEADIVDDFNFVLHLRHCNVEVTGGISSVIRADLVYTDYAETITRFARKFLDGRPHFDYILTH